MDYFDNNSFILDRSSSPNKPFATTFPFASSTKGAGIDSTWYWIAIGSFQNFRFETCVQVNWSFAIASFHLAASLSKETPTIFNPLEWNSLYSATILGFSALQGAHQEAQKSTIVTFPKLSLRLIIFPAGLGAEKSELHLAVPTGASAGAGGPAFTEGDFKALIFSAIALPGFVVFNDSSRPENNFSMF